MRRRLRSAIASLTLRRASLGVSVGLLMLAPASMAGAQGTKSPAPTVPATYRQLGRGKLPIVPFMEIGATDGLFLRNAGMPVYGVTGIFYDVDDVRAHGKDERIGVAEFNEGLEFAYRLVKAVASPAR